MQLHLFGKPFDAAYLLSVLLIPRGHQFLESLAEIHIEGGSVIVGQSGFAGFISDKEKAVYSFSSAHNRDVAFFDRRYQPFAEAYKYNFIHVPQGNFLNGKDKNVVEFLQNYKIGEEIEKIFAGTASPVAGLVTGGNSSETISATLTETHADAAAPESLAATIEARVQNPVNWEEIKARIEKAQSLDEIRQFEPNR